MLRRLNPGDELPPAMQRTLDVLRQRPMRAAEVAAELNLTRGTAGQYLWALAASRLADCTPRRGPRATWRALPGAQAAPPRRVSCVWELGGMP
jgi:DNA-binding IclR family transcriptional regulator